MNDLAFQIALFPKEGFPLNNPSELIAEVAKAVQDSSMVELGKQNIFPDSISKSENLGQDFPRLIAATKDDSVVFQASDKKINLIFQMVNPDDPVKEDEFWKLVESIFTTPSLGRLEFKRVGFIHSYLIDTKDFIPYAKVILADEWEEDIDSFNIQLGYKTQIDDLNLNINIRVSSVLKLGSEEKAIQIQADINTLAEEDISTLGSPLEIIKSLSNKNLTSKYTDPLKATES